MMLTNLYPDLEYSIRINMQDLPIIDVGKVILIRADVNTGIILDAHFSFALNGQNQIVFTVYSNYEECMEYIQAIFRQRNDIEFLIYNANHEILHIYSINNLPNITY